MIHPMEGRYRTEIGDIFEKDSIVQARLDVEAALAKAHAAVGNIPKSAAEVIGKNANIKVVTLERIDEIEKETKHDLMSLVEALSEKCGDAGKYVHLGATSYDIEDTAWALVFRDALKVMIKDAKRLKGVLEEKAEEYKGLVMVGRTHGQHASVITLGLKFAVWVEELRRGIERLERVRKIISFGKMRGAVGTGAALGKKAKEIEEKVMEILKLGVAPATTQIVQRDRHAEAVFAVALLVETLEKIAKEVRNLQRTEIGELEAAFGKKEVGSSAMPQKKNPWRAERICGVARVVRSNVITALENVPLEHERDLTNSAAERVIFPETFVLGHFALKESIGLVEELVVHEDRIKENLEKSGGLILAEAVMTRLVEKGMGRQEAHALVRECALKSYETGLSFGRVLKEEKRVGLSDDEVDEALKPENYVGRAVEIVEEILRK